MELQSKKTVLIFKYDSNIQRNAHMEEMHEKGWFSEINPSVSIIRKPSTDLHVRYEKEDEEGEFL